MSIVTKGDMIEQLTIVRESVLLLADNLEGHNAWQARDIAEHLEGIVTEIHDFQTAAGQAVEQAPVQYLIVDAANLSEWNETYGMPGHDALQARLDLLGAQGFKFCTKLNGEHLLLMKA